MEIVAQIIGFCAMVTSVMTFQFKKHKHLMILQTATAVLFTVHYWMLGQFCNMPSAYTGAAINLIAVARDIVYYHKDKKIFVSNWWTVGFSAAIAVVGIIFWEDWRSLLVIVAMVLNTVSFSFINSQKVRATLLISSPILLVYDILTNSWGGTVNEIISEISIIVGLVRYKKRS